MWVWMTRGIRSRGFCQPESTCGWGAHQRGAPLDSVEVLPPRSRSAWDPFSVTPCSSGIPGDLRLGGPWTPRGFMKASERRAFSTHEFQSRNALPSCSPGAELGKREKPKMPREPRALLKLPIQSSEPQAARSAPPSAGPRSKLFLGENRVLQGAKVTPGVTGTRRSEHQTAYHKFLKKPKRQKHL